MINEVLLAVEEVKHKKASGTGTMTIFSSYLSWNSVKEPAKNSEFKVKYEDIKLQRISPDDNPKIQLQLCLFDDQKHVFQFLNSKGPESQRKDRNAVKELLQQLLPKFRSKQTAPAPNGTVKARNESALSDHKVKLLESNKELLALYKELVTTKIVTPEEFWAIYTPTSVNHKLKDQEVGINSCFLNTLTKSRGGTDIRLSITPDMQEAIFRTYPSIKKMHVEKVPHEMSEKDFWTQFCQSQYFHRDRSKPFSSKDLIYQSIRKDETKYCGELADMASTSRFNLSDFVENSSLRNEGYGVLSRQEIRSEGADDGPHSNSRLLQGFNYRSGAILQSFLGKRSMMDDTSGKDVVKRSREEPLECEDLEESLSASDVSLKKIQPEKYQKALPSASAQDMFTSSSSQAKEILKEALDAFDPLRDVDPEEMPSNVLCLQVLRDLTIEQKNQLEADPVPSTISKSSLVQIKAIFQAQSELLRHFWCCFPVNTPTLETKVVKVANALRNFEEIRLKEAKNKYGVDGEKLFDHMSMQVCCALEKYEAYKRKKRTRPAISRM